MNKRLSILILFCLYIGIVYSQVGIGTTNIYPSVMLQVESSNRGVLFPRIALDSNTDQTTIPNPAVGLTVYNTGEGNFTIKGYLTWDGSVWVRLAAEEPREAGISGIQCTEATISPNTFNAGVPYEGIMEIPYIGGNGASYPAGTPIPSTGNTGLTASLQSGVLQEGNGVLRYTLTGTPLLDSPSTAYFNINVLGNTCNVGVSGSLELEIGNYITFSGVYNTTGLNTNSLLSDQFPGQLPVIDGLRMDLTFYSATFYRPRIFNVESFLQIISLQTFATEVNQNRTILNQTIASGGYSQVDADDIVYWTTTAAEIITANVQVQVATGEWRWYEMKWWAMQATSVTTLKTVFLSVIRKA